MESIVYNDLLIRGYNVDVGVVEMFDKDKEGTRARKQLEVSFAVNQGKMQIVWIVNFFCQQELTDVAVLDPVSAHVEPIQRDNIFNSQR